MTSSAVTDPTTFAEASAVLAANLPGYEAREPQTRGALAVERSLATGRHLLAQAGTGVGKSLMTAIPAVLSGRRVVISTETRALQTQLTEKDLPFLTANLKPFTWALLQGRSRYLCGNRMALVAELNPTLVGRMAKAAAAEGFDGTRDGLGFDVPNDLWAQCCSTADGCSDLGCTKIGNCWASYARKKASESQVVVVNHALLASDLLMAAEYDYSLLGELDVVIADEVHNFVSIVRDNLGTEVSEASISSLTAQVINVLDAHYTPGALSTKAVVAAASQLDAATVLLWMSFAQIMPENETKLRLTASVMESSADEWGRLIEAAQHFANILLGLGSTGDVKADTRVRSLKRRATNLATRLAGFVLDVTDSTVRWMENSPTARGTRRLLLCSQPLDVAPFLSTWLFDRCTFIGVSATIKTGADDFTFVANALGLVDYDALDVGTMFDYSAQSQVIIPANLPEPTGRTLSTWKSIVPRTIIDAINASEGRALVLFTSISAMRQAFDQVSPAVDFECRKQGDASVPVLTEWFKTNTDSVLFATKSFMTGFDVQGEALSLVILDKLSFDVPTDPMNEAMGEYLQRRGINPFNAYSIPRMIMTLQQSFGRLIRHTNDRGVFILLDSRVWTKGYGKQVVASFPQGAPISRTLDTEAIRSVLDPEGTA
jgi:ATP-dependent DNA helicase DinG